MAWEGAGWGARASGDPSAASHPCQTSAHPPRGPATLTGCSGAGSAEEGAGAEGARSWGWGRQKPSLQGFSLPEV